MRKKNDADRLEVSRRQFLQKVAASTVGLAALGAAATSCEKKGRRPLQTNTLPKRILGKTGLEVSILGFGGGSQFLKNPDGKWEPLLEEAVEAGVNLFDTSSTYKWSASMSSEERFGKILPRYRDRIVIGTKFQSRSPDEAARELERSLQRLRTDYVDYLLIHSIEADEDVEAIARQLYPWMMRKKEEGVARYIGFSSMNSAEKSRELLERLDFDLVLLAFNPTRYGNFAEIALPVARRKNVGVLAMKVMRDLVGERASARELLSYVWGIPGVTCAVVGHFGRETLRENVQIARQFCTSPAALDAKELESRLAPLAGPHALCWAKPGYRDGCVC